MLYYEECIWGSS